MKTIISLLFMTVISMSQLRASDIKAPDYDGPVITIAIEIGIPPMCIWGWRICKITFGGPAPTKEGLSGVIEYNPKTSGGGSGGGGGSSWTLTFSREDFSKYYPDFLSNVDGKNTVTFEGSYTLPSEIRDALGATQDLMIKEKTPYPIVFVGGNYSITF